MPTLKATQELYHRSHNYAIGEEFETDEVSAEEIVAAGLAEVVKAEVTQDEVNEPKEKTVADMNRDELNSYATKQGIENPKEFATKADLIEAIEGKQKDGAA